MNYLKKLYNKLHFTLISTKKLNSIKYYSDDSSNVKYMDNNTRAGKIRVINSPHSNCQTYSFKNINLLLHLKENEVYNVLKKSYDFTYKKQILIDVTNRENKKVLKLLEPYYNIVFSNKYESSNTSIMVMTLLRVKSRSVFNNKLKVVRITREARRTDWPVIQGINN